MKNGIYPRGVIYVRPPAFSRWVTALLTVALLLTTWAPLQRHAYARPELGSVVGKLSGPLLNSLGNNELLVWSDPIRHTVRTIIQTPGAVTPALRTAVVLAGGSVVRQFTSINGLLAELPKSNVLAIAARADVDHMSADHLAQQTASHLEVATGADVVRGNKTILNTFTGLDGSGIGIAVLDSGIMVNHSDYYGSLALVSRVAATQDTVSSNTALAQFENVLGLLLGVSLPLPLLGSNKDAYGHGSHVAGVAAGRNSGSSGSPGFQGIAPNARLIDVRVLDARGLGQVSDVIAGIDWVIANRLSLNIKVANLSLGAASTESWVTDPLCRSVRRAVASGITVVASAGNYGQTASGLECYGSISSPGNDPTVITVGAANTHQTNVRSDDSVTHFSSRGPTRGYSVDDSGVKHHDNLIKPDLIAPGNAIVAAESRGSYLISVYYSQLHTSGTGTSAFMKLSGTSVAAPVVAGAVALMLQKNPGLTPPLIKAILQYTAQPVWDANIVEQGAGLLNIEGATRLAGALRSDISSRTALGTIRLGDPLLAAGAAMP
ncbi:MAG TPA: S8 family serine peptidase, partial [Blastocatellia bacterium]|nr:S8 family serine peptidase [Blastocatellia bacterium]